MEPPASFAADAIRDEKVKLLRSVHPLEPRRARRSASCAASTGRATIDGEPVPGYRDEEGVAPDSTTETYLALRLEIDNWRWAGVPFYIRTGKRLAAAGHRGRARSSSRCRSSRCRPSAVDSIEPNTTGAAHPARRGHRGLVRGEGARLSRSGCAPSPSTSRTSRRSPRSRPRRTSGCCSTRLLGDATLFIRGDEVDAVRGASCSRSSTRSTPARCRSPTYPAGSWGPPEADALLADVRRRVEDNREHPRRGARGRRRARGVRRARGGASRRASIALSGGGTAAHVLRAARDRGRRRLVGASRCSSATSGGCRSTIPTRTRAWPGAAFLDEVEPHAIHSMRDAGADDRGGRGRVRRAASATSPPDRRRAPRPRARRAHRVAVPRFAGARRDRAARRRRPATTSTRTRG